MLKSKINKTEFSSGVFTLIKGTTLAQLIPILISPILTRLYTPENFGVFGMYMACAGFISIFIALRYDQALVVSDNKKCLDNLFIGCVVIILFFTLFLLLLVIFAYDEIHNIEFIKSINGWLYLLPFTVLMLGIVNALNARLIWLKKYNGVAKNKVVTTSSNALSSSILGVGGFAKGGLVIGGFISLLCSFSYLVSVNLKNPINRAEIRKSDVINLLVKFKSFPTENLPAGFVNGLYNHGKIIFFSMFLSATFVGYLVLTLRVMQLPLTVIASSISDVLYKSIAEDMNRGNIKALKSRVNKLVIYLSIIGFMPLLVLYLWGDSIFGYVFGEHWRVAGTYASILSLGLYAMFVISPLTKVFWAIEKNNYYLCWEIIRLIVVFVPLFYILKNNYDEIIVVWCFSLSLFFSYVLMFVILKFLLRKLTYVQL